MANTRTLNRRIRSVKNAQQITKAMELVAASKLRRMGDMVEHSRIYADASSAVVARLTHTVEAKAHPFFSGKPSGEKLFVVFSSDRGLAGAFNSNVINTAIKAMEQTQPSVIVFGKKGANFFSRLKNIRLLGAYTDIADNPDINVFAPLIDTVSDGISNGQFSEVNLVYTQYVSTLVQKATVLKMLPIEAGIIDANQEQKSTVFELEPDAESVLDSALRLYVESMLLRVRIEAAASEYASRMMAMNSANRNAGELIDDLTLELNATRQAAITQEIAEITGGANAIE